MLRRPIEITRQTDIEDRGDFTWTVSAFIRWDEKAGLRAGCDTLPMIDALKAQWKGDRL